MKLNFSSAFGLIFILFLIGCDSDRWEVDVNNIQFDQSTARFEQDLFEFAVDSISQSEKEQLLAKYGQFFPLYVEGVMGMGDFTDPQSMDFLQGFTRNKDIQELYQTVQKEYPSGSLDDDFDELKNAFKRFHFHFPNKAIPSIYTMIAALNYNTVTDDSVLAIGLGMYLGEDFPVYPQIGIPKYKFRNYSKEYIVSDAMKAWLMTEFEEEGSKNLIDQMVFTGKIIYMLEAILPDIEQHLFFNYRIEDLQWCEDNESDIWFHFVDMELLFATENHQIRKYMGDAPFVAGFPEGSPGRVGHWVGYQLVNKYMDNHPELSLADLINTNDANKILRESKYKPSR